MIPIFIIVHDRITVLKQSIQSFQNQINYPIQIILHDVASTYPPCIQYLQELKDIVDDGVKLEDYIRKIKYFVICIK